MLLVDLITRIKTLAGALEHTSGSPVWAPDSIHATTRHGIGGLPRRFPRLLIVTEGMEQYGDHGDKLWLMELALESQVNMQPAVEGEGQIVGQNRATNATLGAGLATIHAKLVSSINFVDTNANGTHTTWMVPIPGGSAMTAQGSIATCSTRYKALVEVTS